MKTEEGSRAQVSYQANGRLGLPHPAGSLIPIREVAMKFHSSNGNLAPRLALLVVLISPAAIAQNAAQPVSPAPGAPSTGSSGTTEPSATPSAPLGGAAAQPPAPATE